jgi:hypothetical protein
MDVGSATQISLIQVFENALCELKNENQHANYAREWTTLYLLFAQWHKMLLSLGRNRKKKVSPITTPYFVALCEAMVHIFTLIPDTSTGKQNSKALAQTVKDAVAAGYQGAAHAVRYLDLKVCLDEMYNLLGMAMLSTSVSNDAFMLCH